MTAPTTPVDVNAAFNTERIGQIAAAGLAAERAREAASKRAADFDQRVKDGKMRDLGNGRFQVTDEGSWDDGEVFNLQRGADGMTLLLPEHGLDTNAAGEAQLYSAVPTWHGLGNVIPGGTTDIDQVLELAGLNWDVIPAPVRYLDHLGALRENPDAWATFRNDTGDPLGVVGRQYANGGIVQNRDGFEFLQDLCNVYDVPWQSAGPMRGGKRTFVSMRLPQGVTIDAEGVNDYIELFVVAINSHDGRTPFTVIVTPWRPICRNTERFAVRDAVTRWTVRHTSRALTNLDKARTTLNLTLQYRDAFVAEEETLARTTLTRGEFLTVMQDGDLFPLEDDATKNATTRHNKLMDEMAELFDSNAALLGRTAYAAERAATEFLDHKVAIRPTGEFKGQGGLLRATQALEGANDSKKDRVHKLLLVRAGAR